MYHESQSLLSGELYKILIVDDEDPIRMGLKFSINWNHLGFKVVDCAENVRQALDAFQFNTFDVMITDVRMPDQTGFSLIEKAKAIHPLLKIVVISGYDSFDYAVEAIRAGAEDYILKPIKKQTIINTFTVIKKKLDEERQQTLLSLNSRKIARSYFLSHIVQNDYPREDLILAEIERLRLDISFMQPCIIVAQFPDIRLISEKFFMDNIENLETILLENLLWNDQEHRMRFLTTYIGDHYVIMLESEDAEQCRVALISLLQSTGQRFSIGAGKPTTRLDYIPVSYREAIEQINRPTAAASPSEDTSRLLLMQKKILDRLEEGQYSDLEDLIDKIFGILSNMDQIFVYNWTVNSIQEITAYFDIQLEFQMEQCIEPHRLYRNNMIDVIHTSYLEYLNKIAAEIMMFSSTPNQDLVRRCQDMIKERYADPEFTLYDAADSLGISYGYLSTIFKQISGKSFSNYLIEIRMKNARRLIAQKQYKMYEVADAVGYKTERYFSLSFRKYYGVSPSQLYRGSE